MRDQRGDLSHEESGGEGVRIWDDQGAPLILDRCFLNLADE